MDHMRISSAEPSSVILRHKTVKTRQVREIWSQQLEDKQVPKGGRDQVSGRVSVPCWHATSVANAPWKPVASNHS